MLEFADNMEVADDALTDTATQSGATADAIRGTGTAAKETAKAVKDAAFELLRTEQQLTRDLQTEADKRLQSARDKMAEDKKIRDEAAAAEAQALQDRKDANKKFREDQHEADLAAWGVTDVEYRIAQASLKTLSADKYAALIAQAEEFGIYDLALLAAHNRNLAIEVQSGADAEKEIFRLAHEFINVNADSSFAAYVAIMKKHLADGVIGAQQAAADIAAALQSAQAAAASMSGLAPGEGRDLNSPGGGSSKGGLDQSEIDRRLAQTDGPIMDPYNGTIYFQGGGRFTSHGERIIGPGFCGTSCQIRGVIGGIRFPAGARRSIWRIRQGVENGVASAGRRELYRRKHYAGQCGPRQRRWRRRDDLNQSYYHWRLHPC